MTITLRLCQLNPIVGDIAGNAARIVDAILAARRDKISLIVFPELAITGYPPHDLIERADVVAAGERALAAIVAACEGIAAVVGHVEARGAQRGPGKSLHNTAVAIENGRELARVAKRLLPVYDVFDEARHFAPGTPAGPVTLAGIRWGIAVCEDAWNDGFAAPDVSLPAGYSANPLSDLALAGAQAFLSISASPFSAGKAVRREAMLAHSAKQHRVPLLSVNQTGANDELVFDGRSCVIDAGGVVRARAAAFAESTLDIAWPPTSGEAPPVDGDRVSDMHGALVLGIRDYARKCGFSRALIGLSGGVDSALTAALAVEAIGPANVCGITMPSPFSSAGSVDDSVTLARALGIECLTIPIGGPFAAFQEAVPTLLKPPGLPRENIQARIRGNILMAYSNAQRALLLTTGNKSEMAVGYCTLYGDMAGGLAVIADVFKTDVYRICHLINRKAGRALIPEPTLTKPPSAELAPDQKDTDSLPPYEVLDPILALYVDERASQQQIVARGFDAQVVARVVAMVDRNEFKRRQAPPTIRVSSKAFGIGRRMPIAARLTGL